MAIGIHVSKDPENKELGTRTLTQKNAVFRIKDCPISEINSTADGISSPIRHALLITGSGTCEFSPVITVITLCRYSIARLTMHSVEFSALTGETKADEPKGRNESSDRSQKEVLEQTHGGRTAASRTLIS